MTIARSVQIGAAILAFILAVVWMLPPTTPVTPSVRPTRPGAARLVGTRAPPVSVAADSFDSADTAAMLPPPPPLPPLPAPAPSASPTIAFRAEPAEAMDDYASGDEDSDPYFRAGYRWAERNDIRDGNECRAWRGTAREDGCLAYVEEAPDSAPDPDDGVLPSEPRSPY